MWRNELDKIYILVCNNILELIQRKNGRYSSILKMSPFDLNIFVIYQMLLNAYLINILMKWGNNRDIYNVYRPVYI